MRRVIMMIMVMMIAMTVANAQSMLDKAREKEFKTKMKQLKKEKWQLFGSSRTLEVLLLKHYEKLEATESGAYEVVGVCSRYKLDHLGHSAAVANAYNQYAQNASNHVKGRLLSEMKNNGADTSKDVDAFAAIYEAEVEKEIRNDLQESFAIYRELGKGEKTMQVFFVVNADAATASRLRAMENAIRESEAALHLSGLAKEIAKESF